MEDDKEKEAKPMSAVGCLGRVVFAMFCFFVVMLLLSMAMFSSGANGPLPRLVVWGAGGAVMSGYIFSVSRRYFSKKK